MSFSFGFYNSIDHDRLYDAIQVSKIFDGIIRDGVYATVGDAFIVQADPEPNLVVIGPGRAWFNHTWNENDGYLELELPPPESVVDRIDMIVIDVDERVQSRKNQILVVKGLPSSTPQNPTLIREPEHHQYPLCYIYRNANTPVVSQAKITNTVGSTDCPFVTGVLEGLDVNLMLLQWRQGWTEFLDECRRHLNEWEDVVKEDVRQFVAEFKLQCDEYIALTKAWTTEQQENFRVFYNSFKEELNQQQTEWVEWTDTLKDILDESAAGHLALEIQKINDKMVKDTEYLKEAIFLMDLEIIPCKTTFPNDTQIVERYDNGWYTTTTFLSNGNIDTVIKNASDVYVATKSTVFDTDGSIKETINTSSYTIFWISRTWYVGRFLNNRYNLGLEDSVAGAISNIKQAMASKSMMDALAANFNAMEQLLISYPFTDILKTSPVAITAIAEHTEAMKAMVNRQWGMLLAIPEMVTSMVNNRDVLKYVFSDATRRSRFVNSNTCMMKLTKESTLKQYCIFASTGGEVANVRWVIKDHGHSNYPQYDIHTYSWMVMFGSIRDGAWNQGNAGESTDHIEFHPLGTDDPVYNYSFDKFKGRVTLENPIVVNIAGGAYAICNGVKANGSPGAVTGMSDCVAF